MRRSLTLLGPCVLALACADLKPVARDVCGNGIVEPDHGEDCDLYPAGSCGEPETPAACRFRCSHGPTALACPRDFGCGQDGICRRPSGDYENGPVVRQDATLRLVGGDLDGDGRADLVTIGDSGTQAHLFESSGDPRTVRVTRHSDAMVAINLYTAVAGRQASLLAVNTQGTADHGIVVYEASAEKIFGPAFVFSAVFRFDDLVAAAVTGPPPAPLDGPQSVLLAVRQDGEAHLIMPAPAPDLALPSTAKIVAPILAAQLDEDPVRSPCDELAVLFSGASDLWVYSTCTSDAMGLRWNVGDDGLPVDSLPRVGRADGAVIDGAALGDINGDGHLDLLAWSETGADCAHLSRAFGVGDGTFHSTPQLPAGQGDGTLADFQPGEGLTGDECVHQQSPLIVRDVNGDGIAEVVTRDGMWSQGRLVIPAQGGPWASAAVGDFDADGEWDLVAGAASQRGLHYFSGLRKEGIRRAFDVATRGDPTDLTVGDFDGDGADDVAFVERRVPSLGSALEISFGERGRLPGPLTYLGVQLDEGTRLLSGLIDSPQPPPDAISDLLAIQQPGTIWAFSGDIGRELVTPIILLFLYPDHLLDLKRIAVGGFGPRGAPAVISLASVDDVSADQAVERTEGPGDGTLDFSSRLPPREPNLLPVAQYHRLSSYGAMAAVDLDRDGVDELVVASNVSGEASPPGALADSVGQLVVAQRASTATADWTFTAPLLVDATFLLDATHPLDLDVVDERCLRIADVDGDGFRDVLTMGKRGQETILASYRNDGSGRLDANRRLEFRARDDAGAATLAAATSFVPISTQPGSGARIVLLTPGGPFLAELNPDDATITVDSTPLASVPVYDVIEGDFNADGVPDLALAWAAGAQLLLGVPVRR